MNFSDIEPNDPLLDPLSKKPGPGDCQRIDLGPRDPTKTIEMSLSELKLGQAIADIKETFISTFRQPIEATISKQEGTEELSENPGWKTVAIDITAALAEKLADQLGLKELGEGMVELYARERGRLFTETHLIDVALRKLTPALLKNFLAVGGDALAGLSKELAASLIEKIRSKKASEK